MKPNFKACWPKILLLLPFALVSCLAVSKRDASLNRSALYDPPMVHLEKGTIYHFTEGDLTGTGQIFHSDYAYAYAFLLGLGGPPQPAK